MVGSQIYRAQLIYHTGHIIIVNFNFTNSAIDMNIHLFALFDTANARCTRERRKGKMKRAQTRAYILYVLINVFWRKKSHVVSCYFIRPWFLCSFVMFFFASFFDSSHIHCSINAYLQGYRIVHEHIAVFIQYV